MITDDARAAGRSAQRRGKAREVQFAAWLRDSGLFPHAEVSPVSGRAGDLTGIGDRVSEITVRPYDKLPAKLRQAEADADGLWPAPEYHVWKPMTRGTLEPGTVARSIVIYRAEVIWPMLARLDKLERAGLEQGAAIEEAEMRGYRLGLAAAKEAAR